MDRLKDKLGRGLEKIGELKENAKERMSEKMDQYQIKEKMEQYKEKVGAMRVRFRNS